MLTGFDHMLLFSAKVGWRNLDETGEYTMSSRAN